MTAFIIYAIIVTILFAGYYSVVIWLDLRKLDQRPKSNKENFDVSSMEEEEQPSTIEESGYIVPDVTQEQVAEQKTEGKKDVPEEKKEPSAATKKIEQTENKMEKVAFDTNVSLDLSQMANCLQRCASSKNGKFGVNPNKTSHRQV